MVYLLTLSFYLFLSAYTVCSHKIAETAISEIDKSVTRDRIPWRWVVKEILPEHKDNKIETPDFPTCGKIGLVWNDFVPSFFLFLSAYTVECR